MTPVRWSPRAGDWVEVKSAGEILQTLDAWGDHQQMPFMPEMLRHCGRRYRILGVAHKTCDTVTVTGGRRLQATVHLDDVRCDGAAHAGCQAACLLFWKTAWLRPAEAPAHEIEAPPEPPSVVPLLTGNTERPGADGRRRYRCQATTLVEATSPLAWWDVRQYWRDMTSGNARPALVLRTLLLAGLFHLRHLPYGTRLWLGLYDTVHRWLTGRESPFGEGMIPNGRPTPDERSGLQPGDRVRLKEKAEILATVNMANRNRGLSFDPEMAVYCGGVYTVAARVERIVDEKTGELLEFGNPCIRLETVFCNGWYSGRRLLCPRRITPYFREIWLERVQEPTSPAGVS